MALQTPSAARRRRALCIGALMTSAGLAGCSTVTKISNVDPVAGGGAYQAQYRSARLAFVKTAIEANGARCVNDASPTLIPASAMIEAPETEMLSAGDLVEIRVGQDEMLSGTFKISQDGDLRLPHLPAVRAQGLSVDNVEAAIAQRLLDLGFYRSAPPISVRVSDAAGARVYVSGAVFEPGAMVIGGVGGREVDQARQKAIGFIAESRRLSRALQTAGGVRPDADLAHVTIHRGAGEMTVDVRPALAGKPYADVVLMAGDRIEVASRGCFQEALMVPSSITSAGVRVFMSNLTQPASSNATSAIGKEALELRYGTRFMQAMVGINCAGGARYTNADRSVVLMTHNPVTGQSVVISRRVEEMIARADRDDLNPYIMPGDALACYDSLQTNVLAITNAFGSVMSSALLASKL